MSRPATIYGLLKTRCAFCQKTFKGPDAPARQQLFKRMQTLVSNLTITPCSAYDTIYILQIEARAIMRQLEKLSSSPQED